MSELLCNTQYILIIFEHCFTAQQKTWRIFYLKGVVAKNKRGYRLTAKNNRLSYFYLLDVYKEKIVKTTSTKERIDIVEINS